jgi:hypothetical protein
MPSNTNFDPSRRRLLGAASAACAVAACGGGGGDPGGATPVPTPPPPGSPSFVYSQQPTPASADARLQLLNTQGSAGAAYVGPYAVGNTAFELFVRPTPARSFAYVAQASAPANRTADGFVALLNTQGAAGYVFKGPLVAPGSTDIALYFVRSSTRSTTYAYAYNVFTPDETTTLQQLNARGAQGYAWLGDYAPDPANPAAAIRLFVKDNGSAALYAYAATPLPATRDALLAELATRGQTGAIWKGAYAFGATLRSLYETVSTSTAATQYTLEPATQGTPAAFVDALNVAGANGRFFVGPYAVGGSVYNVFYRGPNTTLPLLGIVIP